MKLILFALSFLFLSSTSFAQQYWPHGFAYPKCSTMPPATSNCTKWPVVNNGFWDQGSTWNNGTVPANNDIVCIPSGITVKIKPGSTYAPEASCQSNPIVTPRLQIFVCGTIDFDPSGKLFLSCFSFIQVYSGGKVTATNGSSDLIQIGANVVWGGPGTGNQGDVNGPWVLSYPYAGAGVLPVAFDYFKAEQQQPYTVRLEWATLVENNSSSFIIEKSIDQKTWSQIGTVLSRGNSNGRTVYSHIDLQPVNGYNFYRLKQVDLDGQVVYSEVVRYNNQVRKNLTVFPNPVADMVQLYGKEPFKAGQTIQVIDAKGTRVKTITLTGGNRLQMDFSGYSSGLYLLQLIENGKLIDNLQIVKQ
jgi:Secretion system C-terminal sorting domain